MRLRELGDSGKIERHPKNKIVRVHAKTARKSPPEIKGYENYGGRGITVCAEWLDFPTFFAAVGPKPGKKYSIERIDNNRGYEHGNVRWATMKEQARNKRTNFFIEIDGEKKLAGEWAKESPVSARMIAWRVKNGWDPRDAITIPPARTGFSLATDRFPVL